MKVIRFPEAHANAGQFDWKAMAEDYQKEHNCRWAEACLEVKRRYPESLAFFGAPEVPK